MYSRNFHIYGVQRMLYQTSRFDQMFLIHAITLNENNRHSFGLKCTGLEIHRRIHVSSNRSISLFGYPTASESRPCPWDSWNGITVARIRNATGQRGRGRGWKFGRFHESQMRNEMTLNSWTFARTTNERANVRRCIVLPAQKGRNATSPRIKARLWYYQHLRQLFCR